MNDQLEEKPRTPGFVIFVAVLNFVSASFAVMGAGVSMLLLIFGNVWGVYGYMSRHMADWNQMSQHSPLGPILPAAPDPANLTFGLNFLFGFILFLSLLFLAFFIAVSIGLLKGKRFAWYSQITMSVMGLIGFPVGTILNGIILVFFFQQPIRGYFKV